MAKKKGKGLSSVERKLKTVKGKIAVLKRNAALKKRLQQKITALKRAESQLAGLKKRK